MIRLLVALRRRQVIGCMALLCSLAALVEGCGRTSANDSVDDDPPSLGGGAAGASGGARAGRSGNAASSGSEAGGESGIDAEGGSGPAGAATAGTTAAGGAAGSAGGAGDATVGSDACVNVSGAGVEPWYDLTIVGAQFATEEGERMRIAVATQQGNRVGVAELPIVDGGFIASIPAVLNAGAYVGVTLYVDRNDDDTCQTDEHVWDWATRSVMGDVRYDVTPDELCGSTMMTCRPWKPTQAACWVGTGDTNLMEQLPCTP
jgi:hypothetical protein